MNLSEKIKGCTTRKEIDELRIEIIRDKDNFLKNQKLFIKKQNSLKRQGKTRYEEGYELIDIIKNTSK